MKHGLGRPILALVALLTAMISYVLVAAPPVQAQPVESGSLAFTSEPGDGIGNGRSYSYSTAAGDTMGVSSNVNDHAVNVSVSGSNGDWWELYLAGPQGQVLVPGTYTNATRYPFNGSGPGLSFYGNGVGCNMLTGSFTITNAVFGDNGYVQTLDATYEQYCDGSTAALRGEVHIANSPPPPRLELGLNVATDGTASTVNGRATVHGTLTCTKATGDWSGLRRG